MLTSRAMDIVRESSRDDGGYKAFFFGFDSSLVYVRWRPIYGLPALHSLSLLCLLSYHLCMISGGLGEKTAEGEGQVCEIKSWNMFSVRYRR